MRAPYRRVTVGAAAAASAAGLVLLALRARDADARARDRFEAPLVDRAAKTTAPAKGIVVLREASSEEVKILEGTFTMGSTEAEVNVSALLCGASDPSGEPCPSSYFSDEVPEHQVYLDAFWIDRTEVTVAAYEQCVRAGACDEPPYASGAERFYRDDLPVVLVRYRDAKGYCEWAKKRLPTEAEWERAARGLAARRFPWGQVYNPELLNHGRSGTRAEPVAATLDDGDGFLELAPVGSFHEGRTPDGIDDLAGNVAEWVSDYYGPYSASDAVNPTGAETGEFRVVRGGAYGGYLYRFDVNPQAPDLLPLGAAVWERGAARAFLQPGERHPWVGFRCARSAGPRDPTVSPSPPK